MVLGRADLVRAIQGNPAPIRPGGDLPTRATARTQLLSRTAMDALPSNSLGMNLVRSLSVRVRAVPAPGPGK